MKSAGALGVPPPPALRDELQRLVLNDLLGPAGGAEEEVDETRVSDRYLVGMLAPRRLVLRPESEDELGLGDDRSGDDGAAEPTAPVAAPSLFPSSFGLTFTVAEDTTSLRVTARWGRYERRESDHAVSDKGGAKRVWKRVPVEGVSASIPLVEGRVRPSVPNPEQPQVTLQGKVRRGDGDWVVTLFLVNGQTEPDQLRDQAWLFQPELMVEASDGSPAFRHRRLRRDPSRIDPARYSEEQEMALLYRDHCEFAVGHGIAVRAVPAPDDPTRAVRVATCVVPTYDVAQQTPPTPADSGFEQLAGLVTDMKELSETPDNDFKAKLEPLVQAYNAWITRQKATAFDGAADNATATRLLERCTRARERIAAGIALLGTDALAAEAFRFANRAMWLQRSRSVFAEQKRRGMTADVDAIAADPLHRRWYPFQLAFILLNLPSIVDPRHPDRGEGAYAVADLLWFPTGGGKTEAYLGLTAFVLGLRRLQGAQGAGGLGVAVLMRYTLRLLTLQQFQRAAALMCACEQIRRDALARGDSRYGTEPFRIGLWVGQRATPNSTEESAAAIERDHGHFKPGGAGGGGTPAQLTSCPWCGTRIERGRDIVVETFSAGRGRTLIFCGDSLGRCPFSRRQSPDEGLPVVVVDEEIYRLLPALVIATVDKFAQMPWNGRTQMLFGRVNGRCPRHGFRSPDLDDADSHPKKGALPAVKTEPHGPLPPPDLIIQDELHLISGPLGSLVGLYETAVDELSTTAIDGRRVRPKVIASTATIRSAAAQVHALFLRRVEIFPPPGIDIGDNFFSLQRRPSAAHPGRRYLGICAPGKRLKAVLIRVYLAYLGAGQKLYEQYGPAVDPWMTLVGYFNSLRELGGMRRLVDDDIRTRLRNLADRGLANRRPPVVDELTSRKSSADIPDVLDRLEIGFNPHDDAARKERRKQGQRVDLPEPYDVLLATNMVSVGVDVKRLGLMVVGGQPKTTAEYIQATSRVGRTWPGLVCTVYNASRPRDLSHYERFAHYHATFYAQVEALSLTPFAARALDRALSALLVSVIRLGGTDLNPNGAAARLDLNHQLVRRALERIAARGEQVTGSGALGEELRRALEQRLRVWLARANTRGGGQTLGYKERKDGVTVPLLHRPEQKPWDAFTCLNSLREVETQVGLILIDSGLAREGDAPAGAD